MTLVGGVVTLPLFGRLDCSPVQARKINTLTVNIKKTVRASKKIAISASPSMRFLGEFGVADLFNDFAPFSLFFSVKIVP